MKTKFENKGISPLSYAITTLAIKSYIKAWKTREPSDLAAVLVPGLPAIILLETIVLPFVVVYDIKRLIDKSRR